MKEESTFLKKWHQDILSYIKESLDYIIANEQLGKEYTQSKNDIMGDDNFNIFKIISSLYYRENFHSDIIAFLLNPKESHHCGDIFLISFLFLLNKIGKNVILSNYFDAEVIREEGRIDILIKSDSSKRVIVIENKINNAQDMPRQMPRYYDYLCDNFTIDAIVYLPLAKTKTPDMGDWTEQDKNNVLPLLVTLPAYDKNSINIVDNWLIPCLSKVDNIDIIATLRQYSSLIKHLNNNIMDSVILEKFYHSLLEGENLNSAKSIRNMLNEIPSYMALRIQEKFGGNCAPFSKIWIYKSADAVFEALNLDGYYLKMDIWCYEHGYDVLFWAPDNQEEEGFRNIVSSLKILSDFEKQEDCRYIKHFDFKDEEGLFSFISSLLKEVRERK